jgi:subtilisin family serine protease
VRIVASAGNNRSDARTFPAAFAVDPSLPAGSLISVGATNPNGSEAYYSNFGPWVTRRAIGTGLISTMPPLRGNEAARPREVVDGIVREGLDPDDFPHGFARWSGTSFAAAVVAAQEARGLLDGSAPHGSAGAVHGP